MWPTEPTFLTYQDPFERFRIGDGAGSWNADPAKRKIMPGSQFPVEAYENYMKQAVPRWLSTDKAIIAAYIALVDKVCPCVMLLHSQGGAFGFKVAEQRPDKVKAIVAVEAATAGNVAKAPKLKNMPALMIFGDYVDQHPRWATFKKIDTEYARCDARRRRHGRVDQSSRHRHQGQFPHADAGQEQRRDRGRDPEMAGQQGLVDEAPEREDIMRRIASLARADHPPDNEPIVAARHGLVPCRRPADRDFTASPIRQVVFTPGGVPAKIDPNGVYQVEQMYAQYFLVAEPQRASCRS